MLATANRAEANRRIWLFGNNSSGGNGSGVAANSTLIHSGDSITIAGNNFNSQATNVNTNTLGFTTWTDAYSGNTLFVPPIGNTGVSGRHAVDIATGWAGEVMQYNPAVVTLMAGTNDLGTTDNSGIIITALNTCLTQTLAGGAKMVLIPILSRSTPNNLTAGAETGRVTVNAWIASQASANVKIPDVSAWDPTTMSQDGLHPSSVGGEIVGTAVAAALNALKSTANVLSVASTAQNMMGSKGLLTGSGGLGFNGATGTFPTGWTQEILCGNTGGTSVGSLISNPNGGNWYQLSMNGGVTASSGLNGTRLQCNITKAIPAGSTVTFMFEVEIDSGWTNLLGFTTTVAGENPTQIAFTGTTANNEIIANTTYPFPNKNIRKYVMRTMPTVVPVGCTAFSFQFCLQFAGGAAGVPISVTARIGRVCAVIGAPFALGSTPIPVNSVAPVITGTAQVGQTLSVSNGTWTNSPASFSYRWYSAGVPIANTATGVPVYTAIGSTYIPVAGDVGNTITCLVFAKNAGGVGTLYTAATAAVIA